MIWFCFWFSAIPTRQSPASSVRPVLRPLILKNDDFSSSFVLLRSCLMLPLIDEISIDSMLAACLMKSFLKA